MLSQFVGEELSADIELVKPEYSPAATVEIHRPELTMYDAQIANLEAQSSQITSSLKPKLMLFASGGYGKPGLNMLADNFEAYYLGGVKISWNLGAFYSKNNSRNKIQTNINSVEIQREAFLFNTSLDIIQKNSKISQCLELLRFDDEIIALRNSVKQASEAKMANGTLSGSDLLRDINAEQMAIQDKILHEMELMLAIYNLKFATNN